MRQDQVDDKWCESNCRVGYCPDDKCVCSTEAPPRQAKQETSDSTATESAASAAQPKPWWKKDEKKKETGKDAAKKPSARAGRSAQPKPWWRDCGDRNCGDDGAEADTQQSDEPSTPKEATRASVHPKQPEPWWRHDDQQQQKQEKMDAGYMYPGSEDWTASAEIYEEGAPDDFDPDKPPPISAVKTKPKPNSYKLDRFGRVQAAAAHR